MTQSTSEQIRQWQGPAVFSFGIRPFFLFGALWAALAMLMWVFMLSGDLDLPTRLEPVSWHAHEFLFGYLGAIIGGYLLTAVPNWTGRLPVVGWRLAALFGLWVAGRIAMATSALWPLGVAEGIDLSFTIVLGGVIIREILAGKKLANLAVLALLSVFTLANLLFHIEAARGDMAAQGFGLRIGVAAVIMLVAVVGGRVIPSLTRNWLVQRKEKSLPAPPMRRFDKAVLVVTVLALLCWVVRPAHGPTGALLLIVGMLHTARLLRWQGSKTFAEPLLLALHLGYAFLPLGALCIGVSILWQDLVPLAAAQHLWMGGTFGLMTLAMMTRAALGHTRQVLHAGRGTVAIYAFLISSVIARLCAGIWAGSATGLFTLSGVLWIAAFLGFAILYGSALVRAKSVGR